MNRNSRRDFIKALGVAGTAATLGGSIERALAIAPRRTNGTIRDVKHVVILMQENRSFDHYFGSMKGVRGFGDRHTIPLPGGRKVWQQHNGARIRPPFWLNTSKTNGIRVPDTPHTYPDTQAAWAQGSLHSWPRYKSDYSMGYYRREDLPFQYALADAFTICDAYHCSIASCTDPNRIVFFSGSNFDPQQRARGINSSYDSSEVYNIRCQIKGAMPEPGYSYHGNAFEWESIPEVLQNHGIDWRIYQDPNNNCTGLFHGGLAFKGFRESRPGDPIYERGMRHWSLERFAQDVKDGALPAVSWILPPADWSEHPDASTPIEGAEFIAGLLDALTANPEVWASTVFFLTYDENDGYFDHVAPPAPPSFNKDGTLAGKATFDLAGEYFDDPQGKWKLAEDDITGAVRPWGLGPRVPMLVVSPWSRGGWVNSETFDHTAIGRFLEKRFDLTIPSISPWHRKMCGDLTSCFDFAAEQDRRFPQLPATGGSRDRLMAHLKRPNVMPWFTAGNVFQEQGVKPARPLPHVMHVDARMAGDGEAMTLHFVNDGAVGVTFHVYDKLHLDRIPRRYAVEAKKRLNDDWALDGDGALDLVVLGPNGFMRSFRRAPGSAWPTLSARYDVRGKALELFLEDAQRPHSPFNIGGDAYGTNAPQRFPAASGPEARVHWNTADSHGWYDFIVEAEGVALGFAGRMEDGKPGFSDPLMHAGKQPALPVSD